MPNKSSNVLRPARFLTISGMVFLSGCMMPGMNSGMYYGNQYGQPMYSPPQVINQGVIGSPGSLYIPESSAPAYNPSDSTFGSDIGDPTDGFGKADDDKPFYGSDPGDGAPLPREPGSSFDPDLGVQYNGAPGFDETPGRPRPSSVQPVSATSAPVEYGFDTENYQWLRGIIGYDQSLRKWFITYSPAARDQFGGNLLLKVSPQQLDEFRDGDMVDVHGYVEPATNGGDNLPTYHVESIQRISM